jgi:hypothetical protein
VIKIAGETVFLWCYDSFRQGDTLLELTNSLLVGRFPALKHVQVSGYRLFKRCVVVKTMRDVFDLPGLEVEEDMTA